MDQLFLVTCVPALTAPAAVGGDAHLAAVVQVRAVHVQLQLLPFMPPQHGEEILILFKRHLVSIMQF